MHTMANIRAIISSFLLIMQTNNGILARIEFMVVLNSILLLILFIFDTYRRRSRRRLVKYILLAVDAASQSMVLHTLGLMESASLRNSLFEVWAVLLVALRHSVNYITVYGLFQGRSQWTMEFGSAVSSIVWAAKLNGTRDSGFKTALWFLWALQPLRVGYMLLAYNGACQSYRQGRSSVLIADYMKNENEQEDSEARSNKNDSSNNPEYKPNGTNHDDDHDDHDDDDCKVGPITDNRISNQRGNFITSSQTENEIEEVSQTDDQEPSSCHPNAEPHQLRGTGEADARTNVPSSIEDYDPLSMRGYQYIIQGETNGTRESGFKKPMWFLWALQPLRVGYMLLAFIRACQSYWQGRSSVLIADYMENEYEQEDPEARNNKSDSSHNPEYKPNGTNHDDDHDCGAGQRTDNRVSNQRGNLITNSPIVNEIEEVSQTDDQEPSSCHPNAEPHQLRSTGEADARTNAPSSIEDYDPLSMKGYRYIIQGETWQEVEAEMLELQDKLQVTVTCKEKFITLERIWMCEGKLLGEWGDKEGELKDLCLSYALYRLLRCRFDDFPLPEKSIPKTRTLLVDNILSMTKNNESTKKGNKGAEELQEGNREENEGTEDQDVTEKQQNLLIECCLVPAKAVWNHFIKAIHKIPPFNKKKQQQEVADRVFEITGTELSFLNDYMYSRLPMIFWRAGGLIVSIVIYISIFGSTCWVLSTVHEYTPSKGDFTHVIHGHNIDVIITWGMLLFILFKETWEILIYLFSDWTKVVLISMYVQHPWMRNRLMEYFIWFFCKYCSMVGRWHGKIDQYNFLEAYDYKPPLCNLAHYISLGSLPTATDGVESKNQIVLPKEVKKAIVKSISSLLKEELKMGRLQGGMPTILSRNKLTEATSQMHELEELHTCSHIILVWHIATSFCEIELCRKYNIYLADFELPSLWSSLNGCSSEPFLVKLERLDKDLRKNVVAANSLSQYCTHLLIKQSDLLPDHIFIAEEVFQHTVQEARNILEGCDTLQTIYRRLKREGRKVEESEKENPENNKNTIMRLSAWLGNILVEKLDEEARWEALAGVWADLLVYMAPNSNVEAHRRCLATGGELITHVWIMLYHAGILENSLVDQRKYNDIENPE